MHRAKVDGEGAGDLLGPRIIAPMLIIFGAAVTGVLVKAFTPRPLRRAVHLTLALGSLTAAFAGSVTVPMHTRRTTSSR